ncbi:serine/threonine-protein kinase RsbW [Nocardia transvalensis]|uniref:Serine/threonine-protein kinase RsbW n=1 Tax=Nocardia transvalensis TaxID=37333 RepID=A0A7W9PFF1_9NOCA|nr:anti-sigma factor [Nocardia transvalensis]MBB5915191.1 serine/threonine-protein kinase RsbW [Nocardia transvalensis]
MSVSDRTSRPEVGTRTIAVQVRAEYEELAMLRAVAETVALFADFGIDRVVDIRLAVEEVATAIVQDGVADSELDCAFGYGDGSMRVRIAGVTASDTGPDRASLGWHIVATLTDSLSTSVGPFDSALGGHRTIVEFEWGTAATDGR